MPFALCHFVWKHKAQEGCSEAEASEQGRPVEPREEGCGRPRWLLGQGMENRQVPQGTGRCRGDILTTAAMGRRAGAGTAQNSTKHVPFPTIRSDELSPRHPWLNGDVALQRHKRPGANPQRRAEPVFVRPPPGLCHRTAPWRPLLRQDFPSSLHAPFPELHVSVLGGGGQFHRGWGPECVFANPCKGRVHFCARY